MQKFRDVLSRWERGSLSMMEAGELLGMSERQFRRYRDRYEEDGLEGLIDGRLGKPSPRRVTASRPEAEQRPRVGTKKRASRSNQETRVGAASP